MRKDWKEIKLGEIATFRNGLNYDKDSNGEGYKIVGVSNFGDKLKPEYSTLSEINPVNTLKIDDYLKVGDIVFVRSNGNKELVGRSMFIDREIDNLVFSGFCIRARFISEEVFPLFCAYFFRTELFRKIISASSGGSNIQNLNQGLLSNSNILLPPFETQKKIASILSAYDDLIENNLRRIKLLEEMAAITYKEWFVNFRVDGQTLEIDGETGLPIGWERKSLTLLGDFINGYAFKPEELGNIGMPIIKIKELKNGLANDTPRNTGLNIPPKYIVNSGDILFSWSASLEVDLWHNEKGLLNQHLFKVSPKENVSKPLLFLCLKNSLSLFNNLTTGATMKHLKRKDLDFVEVPVPLAEQIKDFDSHINPILETIGNLTQQNRLLKESRDILLPRLMNGEVTV